MNENNLLNIPIPRLSQKDILEKIKKYIKKPVGFFHIVSLNPEILVIANESKRFKKVLRSAQMRIIDGVGVILACRFLRIPHGQRFPGVDLMEILLDLAGNLCLRVLFIGGKANLANSLANCYQKKYPKAKFFSLEGIKNIQKPKKKEEAKIFAIVSNFKPHFVFVAFGSPFQELWIERHKNQLNNAVVMGVGGAFDFLSGKVKRAPKVFRFLGLEWFFRLINQPWRWKRQLRLIKFMALVFKEKIKTTISSLCGKNVFYCR